MLIISHFYGMKYGKKRSIRFANFEALKRVSGKHKISLNLPSLLSRAFILGFLVFALTGPIIWYTGTGGNFNFLVAIDSSGSMLADDFTPNRLEAAKRAASEFVDMVSKDSTMALMSFSGTQFVKQLPTDDFEAVKELIDGINVEYSSGTAIGDAIIAGANVLLEDDRARVIVLLTDGQSNVGTVLEKAINYANNKQVTVNTIGMATATGGRFRDLQAVSTLDEDSLRYISENTGGSFYKAETQQELVAAYTDIAKTSTKKVPFKLDLWLFIIAFAILTFEWIIINTKFRIIP